jgi:putative hemolysin
MSIFLLILALIVFFLVAAFFSLAETAILSTNRYKLRHLASQGNRRATQLMAWLDEPEKLLATILLGSNFANVGAATIAAAMVSHLVARPEWENIALAAEAVLLTLIMLLFCELGPKALGARYPERLSLKLVIPIEICVKVLYPLTKLGLKIAALFFSHVKKGTEPVRDTNATTAELRALIASSENREEGMKMLERVLDFSERQVKDVMVPRLEVTALEMGTPLAEILNVVESTRYTRFPVYHGSLDNVAGIVHGKDLMPYLHTQKTFRISQLLRKPVFIPDTAKLDNSIRMLQNAQTHMGIVVDEHGGVEGIVTVEDLIEQIVGEIQDEHDVEIDSVVPHVDGSVMIDASISIRELKERLSLDVPESSQYVTLAGFLLRQAGRLLKEGDEVTYDGDVFRVEQTTGRRIMRVRLIRGTRATESDNSEVARA